MNNLRCPFCNAEINEVNISNTFSLGYTVDLDKQKISSYNIYQNKDKVIRCPECGEDISDYVIEHEDVASIDYLIADPPGLGFFKYTLGKSPKELADLIEKLNYYCVRNDLDMRLLMIHIFSSRSKYIKRISDLIYYLEEFLKVYNKNEQ